MGVLFKRSNLLESEIDAFLREYIESAVLFQEGMKFFFNKSLGSFQDHLDLLRAKEKKADHSRRKIEDHIYRETLIPEYRGDVLQILENADEVINEMTTILIDFSIETPEIPYEFKLDFLSLTESVYHAIENLATAINAINSYFNDFHNTKGPIYKIMAYEKESDQIAENLKRKVFATSFDLALKNQIKYFILKIEGLADQAEDAGDSLIIFSIKRRV